jgi:hypothetical protein
MLENTMCGPQKSFTYLVPRVERAWSMRAYYAVDMPVPEDTADLEEQAHLFGACGTELMASSPTQALEQDALQFPEMNLPSFLEGTKRLQRS